MLKVSEILKATALYFVSREDNNMLESLNYDMAASFDHGLEMHVCCCVEEQRQKSPKIKTRFIIWRKRRMKGGPNNMRHLQQPVASQSAAAYVSTP